MHGNPGAATTGRGPQRGRLGLALGLIAGLGLAGSGMVGCNSHPIYDEPPGFRGIVVPLPPPSFSDAEIIEMDIDGRVDANPPGTRVLLYEYGQDLGWFRYPDDDGNYMFTGVPVYLDDNCLQLDVLEGGEDLQPRRLWKVVLRDGISCEENPLCSATDELGVCACLDPRTDLTECSGG